MRSLLNRLRALVILLLGIVSAPAQTTNVVTPLWEVTLPGHGGQSSPALAVDGTVYQGTFYGWMLAVSPEGRVKWRFKTKREIKSSPAVGADGTIYFGSRDRNCYALSPTGKLKWKFPTGAWVDSSPAIAEDGTVCFGSNDKNVYALTPAGTLKWKFATGGIVSASPAIGADGTIYFGAHDKNFYALTADGKMKWKFATGAEIDASATLGADGTVYFSSNDGYLYALAPDGTQRWRLQTQGYTGSTAVTDEAGNLYLAAGKEYCFVSPEGKMLFHTPSEIALDMAAAATANREIIFSLPWLRIGSFNRDHPWPPAWTHRMSYNLESSPNVDPQGNIYAGNSYALVAIRPPNPAPPAKSSWPLWRGNAQQTGRLAK